MSTLPVPSFTFRHAERINRSLTAAAEKRLLLWLATRLPRWTTSDQLTGLGFAAQLGAGAAFALAHAHPRAVAGVLPCLALNWFGDSLDGTLARVRGQQRPRFGFYADHILDLLGATAMMSGLAASGFTHPGVAIAMLVAFLLLSAESFLATYTLGRFTLSPGLFGPTEIRLLLGAGVCALLRSPYAHLFGHRFLLFDVGGMIASVSMLATVLVLAVRHTTQLFREEPLA